MSRKAGLALAGAIGDWFFATGLLMLVSPLLGARSAVHYVALALLVGSAIGGAAVKKFKKDVGEE